MPLAKATYLLKIFQRQFLRRLPLLPFLFRRLLRRLLFCCLDFLLCQLFLCFRLWRWFWFFGEFHWWKTSCILACIRFCSVQGLKICHCLLSRNQSGKPRKSCGEKQAKQDTRITAVTAREENSYILAEEKFVQNQPFGAGARIRKKI